MLPPLQRLTHATYVWTVFLSALLLFSIQPMVAKMVLPRLGGSPAVWAVSMCFFQGALLLGYCYAFVLNRLVGRQFAVLAHAVLLAAACLVLPVSLPEADTAYLSRWTYLLVPVVLMAAVGLPFFALSANAPLLQSWLTRTAHHGAHDPYFLYAASNAGSLIALLAYPLAIEPLFELRTQSIVWSAGFVLLALMIALSGALMLMGSPQAAEHTRQTSQLMQSGASPIDWRQRLAWTGLAFVPSGLLVAYTTFLSTDIASAPLLWVIPLALFLVTFIVTFRPAMPLPERWLEIAQPVAVVLALASLWSAPLHLAANSATGLIAFVTTCLVCHRRLYSTRPAAAYLTEFYVWMSLGGLLGGVFSAIVAPQIFSTTIEYPLLLAFGFGWKAPALKGPWRSYELAAIIATLLLAVELGFGLKHDWGINPATWSFTTRLMILGFLVMAMLSAMSRPKLQGTLVALTTLLVIMPTQGQNIEYSVRSFFGVHRVRDVDGFRILYHGTTLHGAQRFRTSTNEPLGPSERPEAITYYTSSGPLALGLALARAALTEQRAARVGILGLGVGTMACHSQENEKWRFFEIDPAVVEIARNPRLFNYLSNCKPDADIVMGDARLTLARQEPHSFDYLLVDAFSSDTIPVHLLTVGALQLYLSKLTDRGVLVLHISNRHLDLLSVVAANVATVPGLRAMFAESTGTTLSAMKAQAVIVARHADVLAPLREVAGATPTAPFGSRPWTDDYSDVVSALVRSYRNSRKNPDDAAIEYLSAVISRLPDDELAYKARADEYVRKGNYAAAIDDLTTAIGLRAGDLKAHKTRGMAYQFNDNDRAAVSDLTTYLSKNPNDLEALEVRGIAYGNLGERDKAIADFSRVLFLNPGRERSRQLLMRLNASR